MINRDMRHAGEQMPLPAGQGLLVQAVGVKIQMNVVHGTLFTKFQLAHVQQLPCPKKHTLRPLAKLFFNSVAAMPIGTQ